MTGLDFHNRMKNCGRRFLADDRGTSLVELAIVIPLFLLILFGLIDFGRMSAEFTMADKAMQMAARIAAVRPAACPNVPDIHRRGTVPTGTIPPKFGTLCSAGATVCESRTDICTGDINHPTADEIWLAISPLMPGYASRDQLRFRYQTDPNLGFLGGPYTPVVTVEISDIANATTGTPRLNFQFVTPLGALATLAGATGTPLSSSVPFPAMSTSLPAEDLNLGDNG